MPCLKTEPTQPDIAGAQVPSQARASSSCVLAAAALLPCKQRGTTHSQSNKHRLARRIVPVSSIGTHPSLNNIQIASSDIFASTVLKLNCCDTDMHSRRPHP